MKKILNKLNFLKKYSLVQQLIIVLSIIGLLMVTVIMPFVDYNLHSIIDNQMYEILEESQYSIVHNSYMPYKQSKPTYHIFYNSVKNEFSRSNILENDIYNLYSHLFGNDLEKFIRSGDNILRQKGKYMDKMFYYTMTKVNDEMYLISIVDSDYSLELITSLRNQVVYIQYIFFFILASVLILWVMSLINPLKKIKIYIDEIKDRKKSKLVIDRDDEIGIVSKALVEMKEELDKQEQVKEEMIHNISHDLKTPIALIQTYGQSVKDDIYPYGDKNSSMDVILENASRLEHKVKTLLYLNRLDYLQSEDIQFKQIDMKMLIERVVLQMDALNPNINLVTELHECYFIGSEEHWRVAVENIIENASRYAKSQIKISLCENTLEIYNDGEHIDEDLIQFLFQPYIKGVKGQFGLGLSIVNKIVSMYGYKIQIYNRNIGVSFVIEKNNDTQINNS